MGSRRELWAEGVQRARRLDSYLDETHEGGGEYGGGRVAWEEGEGLPGKYRTAQSAR